MESYRDAIIRLEAQEREASKVIELLQERIQDLDHLLEARRLRYESNESKLKAELSDKDKEIDRLVELYWGKGNR